MIKCTFSCLFCFAALSKSQCYLTKAFVIIGLGILLISCDVTAEWIAWNKAYFDLIFMLKLQHNSFSMNQWNLGADILSGLFRYM